MKGLVAVALFLASAGAACERSDDTSQPTQVQASTSISPAIDPARALADAYEATLAAQTGSYEQVTTTTMLGQELRVNIAGLYDFATLANSATLSLDADGDLAAMLEEQVEGVPMNELTFDIIRVGDDAFMTASSWSVGEDPRWLHIRAEDIDRAIAGTGMNFGFSAGPTALFDLLAQAKDPTVTDGGHIRVQVSAADLLPSLGGSILGNLGNLDDIRIDGRYPVTARIEAGLVTSVSADLTALLERLLEQTDLPQGDRLLEADVRLSVTLGLRDHGDDVSIEPPAKRLWFESSS